jgi:predicted nucleic acid-binding Zn ribbon protein
MIPKDVLDDCRERAREEMGKGKKNWFGAAIVIVIWALALGLVIWVVWG